MRIHRILFRAAASSVVTIAAIWHLSAQQQGIPLQTDPSIMNFQLGEAYERTGNFEKALPLFDQLFRRDPMNFTFFDALRRTYMHLKMYDSAAAIITRRISMSGDDLSLSAELGDCYYKWGKETEAFDTWNSALAKFNHTPTVYRAIANALIENRLYDKALQALEEARSRGQERSSFTQQIALLYAMTFRYEDATREYCTLVADQGMQMLEFARVRISTYSDKPEARPLIVKVARGVASAHEDDVPLQMLCAWMFQEMKQYDEALSITRHIDDLTNAQGREILNFGERLMTDRAYEIAIKAFRDFIDRYPSHVSVPQAEFGYARALEERAMHADTSAGAASQTIDRAGLEAALKSYSSLASGYPMSEYAQQALYRTALIRFNVFFDLDSALGALDEIRRRIPESAANPDIAITTGDVEIARGDLDRALAAYQSLLRQAAPVSQVQRDLARFKCIRIEYFRGQFDSALVHLAPLAQQTGSDIANDAIELQLFITEHRGTSDEPLRAYSNAELMTARHKYSEAIAVLEDLIRRFPSSPLLDDALIRIGDCMKIAGRYAQALESYRRLVNEYPESVHADRALMMMGELYQYELHDREKAISTYESILSKYPDSLLSAEVRKRIRMLRGESS